MVFDFYSRGLCSSRKRSHHGDNSQQCEDHLQPELEADFKIRIIEHAALCASHQSNDRGIIECGPCAETEKASYSKNGVNHANHNLSSKTVDEGQNISMSNNSVLGCKLGDRNNGITRQKQLINSNNASYNDIAVSTADFPAVKCHMIGRNDNSLHVSEAERSVSACNNECIEDQLHLRGYIIGLPSHLLLKVFHYLRLSDLLHRAGLVCKDWYTLSRDSDLWRTINLRGQVKVSDEVITRMTTYSDNVTLLDITDSRLVTSQGLHLALENCPNLQTLLLIR